MKKWSYQDPPPFKPRGPRGSPCGVPSYHFIMSCGNMPRSDSAGSAPVPSRHRAYWYAFPSGYCHWPGQKTSPDRYLPPCAGPPERSVAPNAPHFAQGGTQRGKSRQEGYWTSDPLPG